ncbi:hypothetical protein OB955_11885 [Halobacteria archaeon AArc-m2/3/4]|uniref:Uncharacterized protein n=1 Tax=Natronoglomus mannanivorans TaxID=2979990 RepID=A0ABT2QEW6_9EURY|nr:hypothetical protein [Halobacteria archaeon AArc-m2/3/4]
MADRTIAPRVVRMGSLSPSVDRDETDEHRDHLLKDILTQLVDRIP